MKTLIITSTLFFTFLFNPFSFENNNSELTIEKEKTHSLEIIDNCNTGIVQYEITWSSSASNSDRTDVRRGYIRNYGLSPLTIYIDGNPDRELWSFFLQNINPFVIPPNTNCRKDLIDPKLEMQGEIEEHEEVSSGQF